MRSRRISEGEEASDTITAAWLAGNAVCPGPGLFLLHFQQLVGLDWSPLLLIYIYIYIKARERDQAKNKSKDLSTMFVQYIYIYTP